ncbi:universal stress protein [Salinigranum halophilum]|uniref:universal stress protein n=1 Tax=Salinigranum halophilum TaxID=2565931 RepID=UPI0010A779D6|nr:universal stress protein [Salinigranum halophilum]
MTTYVVGAQSVHTAATLCDYLQTRVGEGDTVVAANSLKGGDDTSAEDARDGEDALNAVASRLGAHCTVETHQYIRDQKPEEDLLQAAEEFDADELVIGIRKRNPTSKVVFGSTAQAVLLNSSVPMAVVPLTRDA